MTRLIEKVQLNEVIEGLNNGFIVAFPTDTVFGIGVLCSDDKAAARMKVAKIRPETKPFPVMVSSLAQLEEIAYLTDRERTIVKNFTPGALTLVVKQKGTINNGLETIAVRIPDDEFVLNLLAAVGPMYVTSANLSGEPACNSDAEVMEQLDGRIDLIVKGEACSHKASTIIDCTKENLVLLRQGELKLEDIESIL